MNFNITDLKESLSNGVITIQDIINLLCESIQENPTADSDYIKLLNKLSENHEFIKVLKEWY